MKPLAVDNRTVQDALDAMLHALPLGSQHPLATLLSLQDHRIGGPWRAGLASDVHVFRSLTRLICCRLRRQRRVLSLADPTSHQTQETALAAVRQDFASDN